MIQPATQPTIPVAALLNADIQPDPIVEVEKQAEKALDLLQSVGVLQPQNKMTIEALLDPADDVHHMEQATDEDICQAALDACKAQEDAEIAGGDNIILMTIAPIHACPVQP
ncbi:hypothetical protein C0989_011284 [Termitomyces sp. Mn162]|nr:hypothetical protein C0989_011284 [Termitomyces sp. Mn162]